MKLIDLPFRKLWAYDTWVCNHGNFHYSITFKGLGVDTTTLVVQHTRARKLTIKHIQVPEAVALLVRMRLGI